jgi:hypothetical protein
VISISPLGAFLPEVDESLATASHLSLRSDPVSRLAPDLLGVLPAKSTIHASTRLADSVDGTASAFWKGKRRDVSQGEQSEGVLT